VKYEILIKAPAKKQVDKLDKSVKVRIRKALDRIAETPYIGKPLRGNLADYWSYRVGNWRVIYEVCDEIVTVIVIGVGHRREVYRAIKEIMSSLKKGK
jgi:mRNA interferase RelE/StbE